MIKVEVVYSLPDEQTLKSIEIPEKSTVKQALIQSGILQEYPNLELSQLEVGIFSKRASLDTCLSDGDRVEIYRPLTIDPKQARRKRAANKN